MFLTRASIFTCILCALFTFHQTQGQADSDDSHSKSSPPCDPPAEVGSSYTFSYVINDTFTNGIMFRSNHSDLGVTTLALCVPPTETRTLKCLNYNPRLFVASITMQDITDYRVTLTILNVTVPRDQADWTRSFGDDGPELGRCRLQFYSLPRVSLSNCPNDSDANSGYIKVGTSPPCSCDVTDAGLPPGKSRWLSVPDRRVLAEGDNSDGSAILDVAFNSSDPNPTYVCQGISSRGSGNDVKYSPEFAYGPDRVAISVENDTSRINICPETSLLSASSSSSETILSLEIYCEVVNGSIILPGFNVALVVVISKTNQRKKYTLLEGRKGRNSTIERFIFDVQIPKDGGVVKPECVATNSIFSDVMATDTAEILVGAPPTTSPVLTFINNNNRREGPAIARYGGITINPSSTTTTTNTDKIYYTMASDTMIDITCVVGGGYPPPDSTTIECVGHTTIAHTTSGSYTRVTVGVFQEMNSTVCSCSAYHTTGCYEAKTEVILDVRYPITIEDFSAVTNLSTPGFVVGMPLTLTCRATGNPLTGLTIESATPRTTTSGVIEQSQGRREIEEFSGNGWREVRMKKVAECRDMTTFTCSAGNKMDSKAVMKNISISIICPPELDVNATKVKPTRSPTNKLTFDIPILGNPKPYQLTLTKQSRCLPEMTNASSLEFVGVEPSLFKLVFLPGNSPYGIVRLTMTQALGEDVGVYRLVVVNGVQPDLEYTFYLGQEVKEGQNSNNNDDDDGGFHLIIAIIVAIVVVISTNIIVAVIFFLLGKKTERQYQAKKREPAVQYIAPPDYLDGDTSPQPEAYSNIDFVRIDNPTILSSSSDYSPHQGEAVAILQPPPVPLPLSKRSAAAATTTTTSATIATSAVASKFAVPSVATAARTNTPTAGPLQQMSNSSSVTPTTYSAVTPPGNFYTYDLPKPQNSRTNDPRDSDNTVSNNNANCNGKNSSYGNSPSIQQKKNNSAVKNLIKPKVKQNKHSQPKDSSADEGHYQEITHSDSENGAYYQIPPNYQMERDRARQLPTKSQPISRFNNKDDVKKMRNESDTSEDAYQQIDIEAQQGTANVTAEIPTERTNPNNSIQPFSSRPDSLPLRSSHRGDNSFTKSNTGDNLPKNKNMGNDSYYNSVKRKNDQRDPGGNSCDGNLSHLGSGISNVEPNIYSEVSPKYEKTSALFSNKDVLGDGDKAETQGRQLPSTVPTTPTYAEPSGNMGREASGHGVTDRGVLYTNGEGQASTDGRNLLTVDNPYVEDSPISPKYEDSTALFTNAGRQSEYEVCDGLEGDSLDPLSSFSSGGNLSNTRINKHRDEADKSHYVLPSLPHESNGSVSEIGPTYSNTNTPASGDGHTEDSTLNDRADISTSSSVGKRVNIRVLNNSNNNNNGNSFVNNDNKSKTRGAYEEVDVDF